MCCSRRQRTQLFCWLEYNCCVDARLPSGRLHAFSERPVPDDVWCLPRRPRLHARRPRGEEIDWRSVGEDAGREGHYCSPIWLQRALEGSGLTARVASSGLGSPETWRALRLFGTSRKGKPNNFIAPIVKGSQKAPLYSPQRSPMLTAAPPIFEKARKRCISL